MELKKVKELIEMMKANDLCELEIVDGQMRIALKRGPGQAAPQVVAMSPVIPVETAAGAGDASLPGRQQSPVAADQPQGALEITAPIVGTFYATPSPNAEPFVEIGSHVDTDTVVCIIEAMKVMNEVKSEVKGIVKKMLVDNGAAVEFGQPLFLVAPE